MQKYQVKGLNLEGKPVTVKVEADSAEEIREVPEDFGLSSIDRIKEPKVNRKELREKKRTWL